MSFFVGSNDTEADAIMDVDLLMRVAPDYYRPRLEAIADLRNADDGSGYKGQEFRRVASFVNVPLFLAARLQEPELLQDKRKFYAFVDRNPQYLTYDRRNKGRMTAKDEIKMPLSAMGIDYPGSIEDFVPVTEEQLVTETQETTSPPPDTQETTP